MKTKVAFGFFFFLLFAFQPVAQATHMTRFKIYSNGCVYGEWDDGIFCTDCGGAMECDYLPVC